MLCRPLSEFQPVIVVRAYDDVNMEAAECISAHFDQSIALCVVFAVRGHGMLRRCNVLLCVD